MRAFTRVFACMCVHACVCMCVCVCVRARACVNIGGMALECELF